MNELTENIVVACLNSQLALSPTETVKLEMIEPEVWLKDMGELLPLLKRANL